MCAAVCGYLGNAALMASPKQMEHTMKSLLFATACLLALVPQAQAGSKVLPDCDDQMVEAALIKYARYGYAVIETVMNTSDVRSKDPTESRFCRSEALTTSGRMIEFVYE